jgi:macrolide-specific efflux system membrane fusion protein
MTADVSVVVSKKANALELPSAAITTTGRTSTVTILKNGKQTITPVTTGLVGTSTTEVLTGVAVGDVVVEPTVSVTASTSSSATGGFGGGGFGGALAGAGAGGGAARGGP